MTNWAYCDECDKRHDLTDPDLTVGRFRPLRFCCPECLEAYHERGETNG
jgi:hypothetical protein